MISRLTESGWKRSDDPEDAQVIIVNSCGFIEPAKEESIETALSFAAEYPDAKVVMAGCLSQRYPEELAGEMPEIAGFMGNRAPDEVAPFLGEVMESKTRIFLPSGPARPTQRRQLLSHPGSAYVKVAEGCDNRCSFCAIPLIRGGLRSKPVDEVVDEIAGLISSGIVEINLVAQDLASYGGDTRGDQSAAGEQTRLFHLLEGILELSGDFWVRLLYIYPERFPREILDLIGPESRILPYFDIPVQHASGAVLRRMGRPAAAGANLALIEEIRTAIPDAILRSTFLLGFFGETEAAFQELLRFQDQAAFDWLGAFAYSHEDSTPAARFGSVPEVSARETERRKRLIEMRQMEITHARMERLVGRELPVLVEELVPHEPLALGRCYAQAPEVDGATVLLIPRSHRDRIQPGAVVAAKITRRNGLDLEAVPL